MSDILVRNWELPENCWDCPFGVSYETDLYCRLHDMPEPLPDRDWEMRDENCPLRMVKHDSD